MLILKSEEMYDPGKKIAVMNVKVIMAMLSFFVELAIAVLSRLSSRLMILACWLMILACWLMILKSFGNRLA
jgi:hypothetical protein